jgi:3-deoxy-manno-octulosonate cytidylyltransferase (CMP-KDO synthetase)
MNELLNMSQHQNLIIIPARISSTRLQRKPLIDIQGKPMLIWCAEQATKANCGDVYVACDSEELSSLCTKYGYKFIMTDPAIPTGSDRVYVASTMIDKSYDLVINLQGDMPKIMPETIKAVVTSLENDVDKKFDIMTAITIFNDEQEKRDINNVSAIVSHGDGSDLKVGDVVNCLYFTRAAEPFPKSVYKHIGIYAYRAEALKKFISYPQSRLEIEERLEQLRALEHDMKIGCVFVDDHVISVDTQGDLERLE